MYESQKTLSTANPLFFPYLTSLYCQGTVLRWLMVGQVAVEYSVLSVCASLRGARAGVVERLSFDRMVTFCKSCGALLRVLIPLIEERFLFGILRLLNRLDVDSALAFVA